MKTTSKVLKDISAKHNAKEGYFFFNEDMSKEFFLGKTRLEAGEKIYNGEVPDFWYETKGNFIMWRYADGQLSNLTKSHVDLNDSYISHVEGDY